jgi:hypothetical protein
MIQVSSSRRKLCRLFSPVITPQFCRSEDQKMSEVSKPLVTSMRDSCAHDTSELLFWYACTVPLLIFFSDYYTSVLWIGESKDIGHFRSFVYVQLDNHVLSS